MITIVISWWVSQESQIDREKYASEAEQVEKEFFPNRLHVHPNVRLIIDSTATNTQENIAFFEGIISQWVEKADGTKEQYGEKFIVSTKTHIDRIKVVVWEILHNQKVEVESYETILENYWPRTKDYIGKVKWSPEYLKQEVLETLGLFVYNHPLGRKYIIPLVWKVLKLLKLR